MRPPTSIKGGENNNTLFLFGGLPWNQNETMNLLYTFDTWSMPQTAGGLVNEKYGATGIVDYNGKMYIFDGHTVKNEPIDMLILDTMNLNWGKGSLVNAPTPRSFYGATLLPNQHIIYLGKEIILILYYICILSTYLSLFS